MSVGPQVPAKLAVKVKQLVPGTLIELFVVDISAMISPSTGLAGPIYNFHNSSAQGLAPLTFQGDDYMPVPIMMEGFEFTSGGKLPRPSLTIGNLATVGYTGRRVSELCRLYDDLADAIIYRKFTLFEFLDGQPGADPLAEMPVEAWAIDSKVAETRDTVSFNLSAPFDVEGAKIPRQQVLANACRWIYRGPIGCIYAGVPKTDQYGVAFVGPLVDRGAWNGATVYAAKDYVYTLVNGVREVYVAKTGAPAGQHPRYFPATWTKDVCIKTVPACGLRFAPAPLHTAAWPAVSRAPVGG
jgi:lambda family phage minor tail protein L